MLAVHDIYINGHIGRPYRESYTAEWWASLALYANVKTYFHRRRHSPWQTGTAGDGRTAASCSQSDPVLSHPGELTHTANKIHTTSTLTAWRLNYNKSVYVTTYSRHK